MPFFSYPAPADWLLPIISIPLWLATIIFRFLHMIGVLGTAIVLAIIIALFARNLMSPIRN
jgi:hypothetical protein